MQKIIVTIDGQSVEIAEKRPRENMAWRAAFEEQFGDLADFLTRTAEKWEEIEFQDAADLVAFLRSAVMRLRPAIEEVWPLCVAYDARFENAFESECIDAFPELLTLAFPFGRALDRVRPYLQTTGLLDRSTRTNSPPTNGDGKSTTPTAPYERNISRPTRAAKSGKRDLSPSK